MIIRHRWEQPSFRLFKGLIITFDYNACLLRTDYFDIMGTSLLTHTALMLVLQDYIHLQVINIAINVLLSIGPTFPCQTRQNAK